MENLRLFIATDIDESTKEKIKKIQTNLKNISSVIKWTEPSTWHLTIKFLGETKKDKVNEIIEKCSIVAKKYSAFQIILKEISAFPNKILPRVIFIDIQFPDAFSKLASDLDLELLDLGFKKENRDFHPHLTLARIKDTKKLLKENPKIMEKIIISYETFESRINIDSFHLYQSILTPTGPNYIKLNSFRLIS